MRGVFVDTSAFYALLNADDPGHSQARRVLEDGRYEFFTSNYVVAETANLLFRRKGARVCLDFLRSLEGGDLFSLVFVTPEAHGRSVAIFEGKAGLGLSFVDCSNLALMEARGAKAVFAFDAAFRKAGADCLP